MWSLAQSAWAGWGIVLGWEGIRLRLAVSCCRWPCIPPQPHGLHASVDFFVARFSCTKAWTSSTERAKDRTRVGVGRVECGLVRYCLRVTPYFVLSCSCPRNHLCARQQGGRQHRPARECKWQRASRRHTAAALAFAFPNLSCIPSERVARLFKLRRGLRLNPPRVF